MTEVTSEPIARMTHIRQERICAGGARQWFKRHGFNWSHFLSNGIPAAHLAATGDDYALRVAARARDEHDG